MSSGRRDGSGRLVGFAVTALLACSGSRANTIVLVPSQDTTIYSENGNLGNGAGEQLFAGRTGSGATRRALLAFDLSSIPDGSTVTSVSLEMYCTKSSPGSSPQLVHLHRLLNSWGEGSSDAPGEEGGGYAAQPGDATWTARYFGLFTWVANGGDFASSSASKSVGSPMVSYTWSSSGMVSDVQGWLDAGHTNHGWLVRGNEASSTTVRRFGSRQNIVVLYRPRLTISYTPPPVTSVGATPDGHHVPGAPLTVGWTGTGELELSWGASCVASIDDYAVYQGTLGSFTERIPLTCSTGRALTLTISPAPESVYWLVVPVDPEGGAEGSYGTASDGSERPPSANACFPQLLGDATCP